MGAENEGGDFQQALAHDALLAAVHDGVIVADHAHVVLWANPAALELLTDAHTPPQGRLVESFVDQLNVGEVADCLTAVYERGAGRALRVPAADTGRDLLLHVERVEQDGWESPLLMVTLQDVTGTVDAHRELAAMRSLLDQWPGFVGIVDRRGNVVYVNDRARKLLGRGKDEDLSTLRTIDIFGADVFARYYGEIRPLLLAGASWSGFLELVNGTEVWTQMSAGVGPGDDDIDWLVAVTGAEEEAAVPGDLAFRANHDPLTGLANRVLFLDRLRLALLRRDRRRHPVTVAFLDLNGFKSVNDTEGHHAGDEVLASVAARIRSSVRPADTAARWGGDEFVVLCEDAPDGAPIARRLADGISGQPFRYGDQEVLLTASVGTATSPPGPNNADELVAMADDAMYRSKPGH